MSETPQTAVSDTLEAEQDTNDDKKPCQCNELPDGFPCWPCFNTGAEDFGGEFA